MPLVKDTVGGHQCVVWRLIRLSQYADQCVVLSQTSGLNRQIVQDNEAQQVLVRSKDLVMSGGDGSASGDQGEMS